MNRTALLFTLLTLLTAALFVADLASGSVPVAAGDVWAALTGGACDPATRDIILKIRLLKAVMAVAATSLQFGYKTMKLFPAGSMPRHYVKDLQGPFDGTNYMAIGGVSPANIREFFDAGCISVGLASSLMPKEAVAANDWEACAAYVRGMVDQIRR